MVRYCLGCYWPKLKFPGRLSAVKLERPDSCGQKRSARLWSSIYSGVTIVELRRGGCHRMEPDPVALICQREIPAAAGGVSYQLSDYFDKWINWSDDAGRALGEKQILAR